MDIKLLIKQLESCPCGREHKVNIKAVEIESDLVNCTGEILSSNGFPKNILVVADNNTLHASEGILESLVKSGYKYAIKLYDNLRTADMKEVEVIEGLCVEVEGVLSVGSGSLNDICRLASFRQNKEFAIFATASSMDGFASGTASITHNNFKITHPAHQPSIIIADTKILANAPAELKAAGFGDMVAKYIALVDWKVSHLVTGEYYCERIAALTKRALDRMIMLADKVTQSDEETAAAIMEALVFTGIAMALSDSVRPASGTEHTISHFWEIKKLEQGLLSDFHGKKVGVATVIVNRIYKELALHKTINPVVEKLNWNEIRAAYGENFIDEVIKFNNPPVTAETTPERIEECWVEIRRIVNEELPSNEELLHLMKVAGAATTTDEIGVAPDLAKLGVKYHPYMRHRMTLMRLIPMLGIQVEY